MLSYEQIKEQNQAGEFWAIGDDGKQYAASYSPEFKNMFFCIPYTVEILGYIKR